MGVFWFCRVRVGVVARASQPLRYRDEYDQRLRLCDRVLLAAWALTIAAFLLIAGPQAMVPGQERFALCLVAPTIVLLARGAALAWEAAWTAVARRLGSGHAGRLAAGGRFPRPLLPLHRANWRPGAPHVPHRGRRTEAGRPASDPDRRATARSGSSAPNGGIVGRFVTWHCPIAAFACRSPRKSYRRPTIGGRWPKGGCGSSSSAARRVAAGRIATGRPKADPLAISRLRPPARSSACSMPAPSNVDTIATIVTMGQTFSVQRRLADKVTHRPIPSARFQARIDWKVLVVGITV